MSEPGSPTGNGTPRPSATGRSDLDAVAMRREMARLQQRVERLERRLHDRSAQLEDVSRRFRRLERRIDRAYATFPVRTALGIRRRLHHLLK